MTKQEATDRIRATLQDLDEGVRRSPPDVAEVVLYALRGSAPDDDAWLRDVVTCMHERVALLPG